MAEKAKGAQENMNLAKEREGDSRTISASFRSFVEQPEERRIENLTSGRRAQKRRRERRNENLARERERERDSTPISTSIENLARERERDSTEPEEEPEERRIENLTSGRRAQKRRRERDSTPISTRFRSFVEDPEERRIENLSRERDSTRMSARFRSFMDEFEDRRMELTQRMRDPHRRVHSLHLRSKEDPEKMIYESLSERSRQILDQTAVALDVSFFLREEGEICCICREQFKSNGAAITQWPAECAHVFHLNCLLPWLSEHRSCPLCRATF